MPSCTEPEGEAHESANRGTNHGYRSSPPHSQPPYPLATPSPYHYPPRSSPPPPPPYYPHPTSGSPQFRHMPHHHQRAPRLFPTEPHSMRPSSLYGDERVQEMRRSPPAHPLAVLPSPSESSRPGGACTCKKSRCLKLYCQCFASSSTCGPKCKCLVCHNTTVHADAIEKARRTILERNPAAFDDKFPPKNSPSRSYPPGMNGRPPAVPHHHATQPPHYAPSPPRGGGYSFRSPSPTQHFSQKHSRTNRFGCKCRRSFCLKKYCECYQNGSHCGLNCKCTNCKNFPNEETVSANNNVPVATKVESMATTEPEYEKPSLHGRHVSTDDDMPVRECKDQDEAEERDDERMAIIAAVAMTELLGGKASSGGIASHNPDDRDRSSMTVTPPVPVQQHVSGQSFNVDANSYKRKIEEETINKSLPPKKRKPPSPSLEDQEVRAVVSSNSSLSVESRNPSPVSTYRAPQYPPPHRFPYHSTRRLPHPYPPQPSHEYPAELSMPHRGLLPAPRASPPPSYPREAPPQYQQPPPQYPRGSPTRYHQTEPSQPTYDELVRNSGLPKSLSFRKICSKCGKTRGEHGDMGFGNKCVYQDCGRCGAGIETHKKAGQPMGILCQLTVEDGATPGAAAAYDRKIRELAARADLQRELQRQKQETAKRLLAAGAP